MDRDQQVLGAGYSKTMESRRVDALRKVANENVDRPIWKAMEAARKNQPKSQPIDPALQEDLDRSLGSLQDALKADVLPWKSKK